NLAQDVADDDPCGSGVVDDQGTHCRYPWRKSWVGSGLQELRNSNQLRAQLSTGPQYLNWATNFCRSKAILANSSAELLVLLAPSVVLRAAWATPVMFWAISLLPCAASPTLRLISPVVAVCSSTALAMVFCRSLIWLMILPIWPMASTAPLVSVWIASIFWPMSSVVLAVCLASSLTSLATTAKPLPASPARAASMVAFRASKFVCWAILVMTLMTLPISALDSPSLATVWFVFSATLTAAMAPLAASVAFLAISRMLAPIWSAPVATVVTFLLPSSAAAEATLACAAVSSALDAICWLTAVNCRDALASVWAVSAMLETFWRRLVRNF